MKKAICINTEIIESTDRDLNVKLFRIYEYRTPMGHNVNYPYYIIDQNCIDNPWMLKNSKLPSSKFHGYPIKEETFKKVFKPLD